MTEISNKALALLILATLVVVVTATTLQLNGGITGLATEGEGDVFLTINQNLAIEVDAGNNTINFGTCTPNASGPFTVSTEDGVDESNGQCNATELSSIQEIQVNNIGNVDAGINVTGECPISDFLPETTVDNNDFAFQTQGNCTAPVGSWTTLDNSSNQACDNLTVAGSLYMAANVTIDSDTQTGQSCTGLGDATTNTLTFTGYSIP